MQMAMESLNVSLAGTWPPMGAGQLRPSRSLMVCLTCQHFQHTLAEAGVTQPVCARHQQLLPQGAHLDHAATSGCSDWRRRSAGAQREPDSLQILYKHKQKPPRERGLSDSVDLNRLVCSRRNRLIPDQPMAGACRATGVDSTAARSRGKL